MKTAYRTLLCLTLVVLLAAGCESGPRVKMAPGYETTATQPEVDADPEGTPRPTAVPPTPTPASLTLDDTLYTLPSNVFSFYTPQGWNLTLEDVDYARFQEPDGKAWFEVAVESTGYELSQDYLKNYMDAMLVSLYSGVEGYELIESQADEDRTWFISTYRKYDYDWKVYDVFIQRNQAVYAMSFHALDMLWEAYLPGFQEVADSLETRSAYVSDDQVQRTDGWIYSDMRPYTSPNDQFTLMIPMGWTFSLGQDVIEGAVLDGAYSPDGQAAVEIIVYDGKDVTDVGQFSEPLIRQYYGKDLEFLDHNLLDDGRIRADWQIGSQNIRAYSFFWMGDSIVYIMTLKYNDKDSGSNQNICNKIGDSFRFSDGN